MSGHMFVNGANSCDKVAVVGENGCAGEGANVAESKEGNASSLSRTVGCLPRNYLTSPKAQENYDKKYREVLNASRQPNDKTGSLKNAAENAQKSEGSFATQGKDIQSDNSVQATTAVTVQGAKPEGFKAKMLARLKVIEDFINSILIALHIKKAPNSEPINLAPLLNTNQPITQETISQQPEEKETISQRAKVEEPINQRPEVEEAINQQPKVKEGISQQDSKQITSEDVKKPRPTVKAGQDFAEKALQLQMTCSEIKKLIKGDSEAPLVELSQEKQQEVNQLIAEVKDKSVAEKEVACNKLILKNLVSFMSDVYTKKDTMSLKGFQEMSKGVIHLQDLLNDVMEELVPGSKVSDFLENFEVNRSTCPKELVACYDDAMKAIEENTYADQEYQTFKAQNKSEEELDAQGKFVNETRGKAEDLLDKLAILARAHLFFEGLKKDEIDNFKSLLSDVITYTQRKPIESLEYLESLELFLAKLDPASFEKFFKTRAK